MSLPLRFDYRFAKPNKIQFQHVDTVFLLFNFLLASISPANCFQYWSRFAPIPEDAVGLGSSCKSALQCLLFIPGSQCNWDQRVCECQPYHVASPNNTMCLPGVLLTFDCEIDAQCEAKVSNSRCVAGRCACKDNHIKIRFDKCLPPASLDSYCLNNEMCSSSDPYAHCKWIVPRAYGKCKCLDDHLYSAADKRCYPRLGHTCYKSSDCQKGTQNSKCGSMSDQKNTLIVVKASVRKHNQKNKLSNQNKPKPRNLAYSPKYSSSSKYSHVAKTGYRSASRQSKLTKSFKESASLPNSCRCPADYKESEDRTKCVKVETPKRSSSVVQLSPLVYPIASASNSVNQRISPKLPLPSSSNAPFNSSLTPVSIGKRCRNSQECRLRDPYTFCSSDGVCDCMNQNSKCNAQNTGCYPDTFQCRDGTCISHYYLCDKSDDCGDNSDESECVRFNCPKEAFQCDDGHCISKAKVCNGLQDCLDGSDESQCKRHQCAKHLSFQSRDGQCLPLYTFCNAVIDAADRSDEDASVCEASKQCPPFSFQCRNKKCRSTAILCSGADGCGDNSDEEKCYSCYCSRPDRPTN